MKKSFFFLLLSFSFLLSDAQSQSQPLSGSNHAVKADAEEAAVRAAILDYVEALYLADSTRIEKSVAPKLRKIGYWYDQKNEVYHDNLEMTFEELRKLAASWNSSGERADQHSPKDIIVYEVNDKTAIAKLTAVWGIDYFQLAKTKGKWSIQNVLWQSLPR